MNRIWKTYRWFNCWVYRAVKSPLNTGTPGFNARFSNESKLPLNYNRYMFADTAYAKGTILDTYLGIFVQVTSGAGIMYWMIGGHEMPEKEPSAARNLKDLSNGTENSENVDVSIKIKNSSSMTATEKLLFEKYLIRLAQNYYADYKLDQQIISEETNTNLIDKSGDLSKKLVLGGGTSSGSNKKASLLPQTMSTENSMKDKTIRIGTIAGVAKKLVEKYNFGRGKSDNVNKLDPQIKDENKNNSGDSSKKLVPGGGTNGSNTLASLLPQNMSTQNLMEDEKSNYGIPMGLIPPGFKDSEKDTNVPTIEQQ